MQVELAEWDLRVLLSPDCLPWLGAEVPVVAHQKVCGEYQQLVLASPHFFLLPSLYGELLHRL